MKAIEYKVSNLRYITMKYLSMVNKKFIYGPLSLAKLVDKPEPKLIGEGWVKIKVIMSGVCGSDIGALEARQSFYLEPYMSKNFILGHENVGFVAEKGKKVKNVKIGDRVVVQPFLACKQRGIKNECHFCKTGNYSLCENVNGGKLSRGISIGLNKDTGGGWSEAFLAHYSNVFKLPEEVSNEEAVLIDSFSCALHAVIRNMPEKNDTAVVYGCGTVGLSTIASIRALGLKNRIIALCTRSFQKEMALKLGANIVLNPRRDNLFEEMAKISGAKLYKPTLGRPTLEGGVEIIYDCVADEDTINNSLRFLKASGKLVIIATAGVIGKIDMAPVWFRELNITGSCEQDFELYKKSMKTTYEIAIGLIKDKKVNLKPLVTHKFRLSDFKKAIKTAVDKNKGSIKVVFYNEKV